MNPLEFVFKLLWNAWPFVKEMVLEGRTLKDTFLTNRRRAIFSVIVMASFAFNVLNIGVESRMMAVMMKYVKLEKLHQALVLEDARLKESMLSNDCKIPPPVDPVPAASSPVAPSSTHSDDSNYEALKSTFTNLNRH